MSEARPDRKPAIRPPFPEERPVTIRKHGHTRTDPWAWLSERDDPKVLAHLEAENAYTETLMGPHQELVDRLYTELTGRIEETHVSASYPKGGFLYQSRTAKGQNYRSYYRKPLDGPGGWTLYFDANAEAEERKYLDVAYLDISPDDALLAYAIDFEGDENYTLRFRDLTTGKDKPFALRNVSSEGEWDASGRFFYFVREDASRRPDRIFRYELGADPESAQVVYREEDARYFAGLYKSQDGHYLFAVSESQETTEIHYLEAAESKESFACFMPRREGIQYWLEHHEGSWLLRTNEGAPDFRLLRLPVGQRDPGSAETILPARKGVRLEDLLVLRHYWIFFERENGLDHIRVRKLAEGSIHTIRMDDPVYDLFAEDNELYDTHLLQYTCSSPIRPAVTCACNLENGERSVLRRQQVPSGHDPDHYTVYRIEAASHDGVRIPLTVFHKKGLARDGSNPAYLYAYGSYGSTVDMCFRTSWITWLEKGYVLAVPHVRGGGLLGEKWYQEGKSGKKQNSFRDFIACAECLIEQGLTRPGNLVIEGGSAGGLLVGAVLNERPDLFRAALASVPFVDVLNTMLDPELPLTTFEYEEWGNPEKKEVFENILGYAPYENVRDAVYPAILATAGFNDTRVSYWEPAKWVARLRRHQKGPAPVLLKTRLDSGHQGASGRYEHLKEMAFGQAFLLTDWLAGSPAP